MMGAPVIVYANFLGASSTVLGIIAAFTPLMTIFQLPAAEHLDRYSYREFVTMGWGTRTILIFVVAAIPLAGFLNNVSKLIGLLTLLFFFNLLRGISSVAWMPWMAHLLPEEMRGRFLSVDQFFMYAGCLLSLLASALVIGGPTNESTFALVFLISGLGGVASLLFLGRLPDVPVGEAMPYGSMRVPWREMLAYQPFRQLLIFNVIYAAVLGSLSVFAIEFLREASTFDVTAVLQLSALSFLGALVALPFCGRVVDAIGSKPLMRIATGRFLGGGEAFSRGRGGIRMVRPRLTASRDRPLDQEEGQVREKGGRSRRHCDNAQPAHHAQSVEHPPDVGAEDDAGRGRTLVDRTTTNGRDDGDQHHASDRKNRPRDDDPKNNRVSPESVHGSQTIRLGMLSKPALVICFRRDTLATFL